jgi:esterase/lipase superfamily enzyme
MKHLPVLYVTNRVKKTTDGKLSYGGTAAGKLNFGRATIVIPGTEIKRQAIRRAKAAGLLDHATGKLTTAAQLKLLRLHPLHDFSRLAEEAEQAMRRAGQFKDQLLIFVHGFNVSFEEALLRASQISFDLEFDGALMPFSWPSKGELSRYQDDELSAAAAADKLVAMIRKLAKLIPGKKVHFIAHSMGNRVLLRALDQLSRDENDWHTVFNSLELGEIIWAHPDVDQIEFTRLTKRLGGLGARMTLYSTRDDWALWASKLLHGKNRAGSGLVTVPGVDTIDITGMKAVDRGWFEFDLNHNVFVRNPALFGDITRLLLTSQRPVHRRTPDFSSTKYEGKRIWHYRSVAIAKQ